MRTEFKFLNKDTNEWESVAPEVWRWRALYADGRELQQFNEDNGIFHQFKEIDQSRLTTFIIESPHYVHKYHLPFTPFEDKLIHFYRTMDLFIQTGVDKDGDPAGFRHKERYVIFGKENESAKLLHSVDKQGNLYITDDLETITIAKGRKRLSA